MKLMAALIAQNFKCSVTVSKRKTVQATRRATTAPLMASVSFDIVVSYRRAGFWTPAEERLVQTALQKALAPCIWKLFGADGNLNSFRYVATPLS